VGFVLMGEKSKKWANTDSRELGIVPEKSTWAEQDELGWRVLSISRQSG
jgi:hypothetical protein